jgi:hypothetical protein
MSVELSEKLLANAAGWEAVKRARAFLEQGQVVSSYWAPPLLRGVVRVGEVFFRASLVIKGEIDIDNLCTIFAAAAQTVFAVARCERNSN